MLNRDEWETIRDKADWEGGWPEYILGYGGPQTEQVEADLELQSLIETVREAWENLDVRLQQYEQFYDNNPYDFETEGIERTI